MNNLSVLIICKDEENNIRRCLESITFADEIVILDNGSTDKTTDICKEYGCSIFYNEKWEGFGKCKQQVVNLAKNNWVFLIDADEVLSDSLRSEIIKVLSDNCSKNAYRIKRTSFYLGKCIKYSGWQNDYTLRFFNRNFGNFNDRVIHEFVEVNCEIGILHQPLYHYSYPTIKTHFQKMIFYAQTISNEKKQKGKNSSVFKAFLNGFGKFGKMYFLKFGFLDGCIGFVLAINSSIGNFLKYLFLWELNKKGRK